MKKTQNAKLYEHLYQTIGRAAGISKNTVEKYVAEPLTFARSADIFR